MTKEEIIKKCKEILQQYASDKDKVEALKETDEIAETLGLDSLDLVEMIMALEEDFGVSIAESDVPNIKTFNDIVSYIENELKKK